MADPVELGSVDHVMVSHIFGAVSCAVRFETVEPHPRFALSWARSLQRDLAAHGYDIVKVREPIESATYSRVGGES